jgi:phage shock protein A
MWARIKAVFRSLFGWLIRGAEKPELLLRQYMDDMRAQIPRLNAQVAEVIKHEKLLEMQHERLEQRVAELEPKVETAVRMGPEKKEAAKTLITALQASQSELTETAEQLERARENSKQMLRKRDAYEQRVRQQIEEAKRQLSRAKRAEVEQQMASLMTSFEAGDQQDVLERVTERIDEELARAQARQDVAATSVESELAEISQSVADQEAEVAYVEYQRQLGLIPDEEAERTMEAIEAEAAPVEEAAEIPETAAEQEAEEAPEIETEEQ